MALEKMVGCEQHRVYNAPYEAVVEKGTAVNAPLALVRGDLAPSYMPYGEHSRGQSRLTRPFSYEKFCEVRRRLEVVPQQRSPAEESVRTSTGWRVMTEDHQGSCISSSSA